MKSHTRQTRGVRMYIWYVYVDRNIARGCTILSASMAPGVRALSLSSRGGSSRIPYPADITTRNKSTANRR